MAESNDSTPKQRVFKTSEAQRAKDRARHARNREKRNARTREYYLKNKHLWQNPDGTWKRTPYSPEQAKEIAARSYRKNAWRRLARERAERAKKRLERFGCCPICEGQNVHLVWDHDHDTGEFRGYICDHCNWMLGHSRDNVGTLERAIGYLRRSREEVCKRSA